jgi:hypothetical protein
VDEKRAVRGFINRLLPKRTAEPLTDS